MQAKKIHLTVAPSGGVVPFSSVEEAWFWFVQAHMARQEGARIVKGIGYTQRPCEPVDILTIIDRLYRARHLHIDHIRVLHFYGVRRMAPDPDRKRERYAHLLWHEAIKRMGDIFIRKGIVSEAAVGLYHE